jgi:hypothetical protein
MEFPMKLRQLALGLSALLFFAAAPAAVLINELDADTPSTDVAEFVELYDGGVGSTALAGTALVFFNGSNDLSYLCINLTGVTDGSGYYVVGNVGIVGANQTFGDNTLQNGADAVALYQANCASFPNNTAPTLTNLLDAVVYDTDDADDAGLLVLLNDGQPQVNENGGGNGAGQSIGRQPDAAGGARNTGGYASLTPTPGTTNDSSPPVANDKRIYEIQGAGHVSPERGNGVTNVPGIVTAVGSNGFYMQDPDGDANLATSDGIFVFTSAAPGVAVGQQVKVDGTVAEFRRGSSFGAVDCPADSDACGLTVTEIDGPTVNDATGQPLFTNISVAVTVIGSGGRVPPAQFIDNDTSGSVEVPAQTNYDPTQDGVDFYESMEGMLLQINDTLVTGPTNGFGEIWVVGDGGANATGLNARGGVTLADRLEGIDYNPERIQLDDDLVPGAGLRAPLVDVGDSLGDVTGVLSYSFGNFELFYAATPPVTSIGTPPADATLVGDATHLSIAAYNVENLDPNDNDTCNGSTADNDVADGRFEAFAGQIVNQLNAPDIVSLSEVQDNNGCADDGVVAADQTLDLLTQAIVTAGGPSYSYALVNPQNGQDGGQPQGNIRVAFLYNAARVGFVPGTLGAGDALTASQPVLDAGRLALTLSPGRIDPADAAWSNSRKPLAGVFEFNGRRLLVVGNHFNSKGGDYPLFGRFQPPVLTTETQRLQQAEAVHDFVAAVLDADPSARVVVLGDLNDFDFSAPLDVLRDGPLGTETVLINLGTVLVPDEAERYSYVFEGNSQELDHLLVTAALLPGAQYEAVHLNAGFSAQLSDHDPLLALLSIAPPDQAPDAFSFIPVNNATPGTVYTSNAITVSGIEMPVAISIAGGSYSINGGGYTNSAGTVASGDRVHVRLTSSASSGTTTSATLALGTGGGAQSAAFSVTTAAAPPTVTLSFSRSRILILLGNSRLSWSASNASSCVAGGAWSGARPTSGSVVVWASLLPGVRNYTLTCTGPGGTRSATATLSSVLFP